MAGRKAPLLAAIATLAVAAAGAAAWWLTRPAAVPGGPVTVMVPALSARETLGAQSFARNCQPCHGPNAAGGDKGPPLVHPIYQPGHHSDLAFAFAMQRGTQQHHWHFGDMPAQPQVPLAEQGAITAYIRALQRANGILAE